MQKSQHQGNLAKLSHTDLDAEFDDIDACKKSGATQDEMDDLCLRGYLLAPQEIHLRNNPLGPRKVGNQKLVKSTRHTTTGETRRIRPKTAKLQPVKHSTPTTLCM